MVRGSGDRICLWECERVMGVTRIARRRGKGGVEGNSLREW